MVIISSITFVVTTIILNFVDVCVKVVCKCVRASERVSVSEWWCVLVCDGGVCVCVMMVCACVRDGGEYKCVMMVCACVRDGDVQVCAFLRVDVSDGGVRVCSHVRVCGGSGGSASIQVTFLFSLVFETKCKTCMNVCVTESVVAVGGEVDG
jgi:hypothetical protein